MSIWAILAAVGLPSAIVAAVVGLLVRRIEKRLDNEEKERQKREAARKDYELFQVKMLTAATALGKANAIAIKNGKCNGETSAALSYLEEVKHDQRDFLISQGIDHLF